MTDKNKTIKIHPEFDSAGNAHYKVLSLPKGSDLLQQCIVYPENVIPVIFIPGVMGSNLKANRKKGKAVWNLNDLSDLALTWFGMNGEKRKERLNPQMAEVDDSGSVDEKQEPCFMCTRRERGWGSVAYTSYAPFLCWLQNTLHDFDNMDNGERLRMCETELITETGNVSLTACEIENSYQYLYPVWAVGYNWLRSNAESAQYLSDKVDEIIRFYQEKGKECDRVILVTHSMGGLVARHYTEKLGGRDKILGVIHGVMPALGAAATYRRMKAGTEFKEGDPQGWATSQVLGGSAEAMTAVLSQSPGPMQLLPGKSYGTRWLKILDDNDVQFYPKEDPWTEIYLKRNKWWGLCEEQFINPGKSFTSHDLDNDWEKYAEIIKDDVETFVEELSEKYHATTYSFYGAEKTHLSYGDVCWQSKTPVIEKWLNKDRPRNAANGRPLNRSEGSSQRSVSTPLGGEGWATGIFQAYRILPPEEAGDGTVPLRSGQIAGHHLQARLRTAVEHEPAFKSTEAQHFTLRSVVKIMQNIGQPANKSS